MEVQRLKSGVLIGSSETVTVGRGHLNGILIIASSSAAPPLATASDEEKATYKALKSKFGADANGVVVSPLTVDDQKNLVFNIVYHGTEREILVPNIDLWKLNSINAYRNNTMYSADFGFIDLGSCFLNSGDEIHIEITHTSTSGTVQINFELGLLSHNRTPFHLFKYEHIQDSATSIKMAYQTFGFVTDATTQYEVENAPYNNYNASADLFRCGAWANPKSNLVGDEGFEVLYDDLDGLESDIFIRSTGWTIVPTIINLRKIMSTEDVDRSTVENTEIIAVRLGKLESVKPDRARAYRHAKNLYKSSVYNQAARVGRNKLKR